MVHCQVTLEDRTITVQIEQKDSSIVIVTFGQTLIFSPPSNKFGARENMMVCRSHQITISTDRVKLSR